MKKSKTLIVGAGLLMSLSFVLGACGNEETAEDKKVAHTYKDTVKDENGFKGTIVSSDKAVDDKKEKEYMAYVYSSTCSHCAKFKPVINEYAQEKTAMKIFAYDIDVEAPQKIAVEYVKKAGLTELATPTLVHIKNGEMVNVYVGEQELENIPKKSLQVEGK